MDTADFDTCRFDRGKPTGGKFDGDKEDQFDV